MGVHVMEFDASDFGLNFVEDGLFIKQLATIKLLYTCSNFLAKLWPPLAISHEVAPVHLNRFDFRDRLRCSDVPNRCEFRIYRLLSLFVIAIIGQLSPDSAMLLAHRRRPYSNRYPFSCIPFQPKPLVLAANRFA